MNTTAIITYALYIVIAVGLTYWVGNTLYKNGRVFILESFRGNEQMADSVNHLPIGGILLYQLLVRKSLPEVRGETDRFCGRDRICGHQSRCCSDRVGRDAFLQHVQHRENAKKSQTPPRCRRISYNELTKEGGRRYISRLFISLTKKRSK